MRVFGLAALSGLVLATSVEATPLVDAEWLHGRIDRDDVAVLDIRNDIDGGSSAAFRAAHIPGAVHSSYGEDGWRTTAGGVPGMLPDTAALERLIGNLGIDDDDHVVIVHGGVSASDFGSAARIYWTFKQLGHETVSILDGGFAAWLEDPSRPLGRGQSAIEPASYEARRAPDEARVSADDVLRQLGGSTVLLDARPQAQFAGAAKHPRANAAGHIPGATHFDQAQWFEPETGRLRDPETVAAALPAAIREGAAEVVSYCNTGHWAATNWFVLSELLGRERVALYDGSMTEWTADPSRPLARSTTATN